MNKSFTQKITHQKNQIKSGTPVNGKENMILFLAESLGVEYKNDKIDFGNNPEVMSLLLSNSR